MDTTYHCDNCSATFTDDDIADGEGHVTEYTVDCGPCDRKRDRELATWARGQQWWDDRKQEAHLLGFTPREGDRMALMQAHS